ncbi:MAG: dephospho-CoA kinase [Weizmannia coagulans]|jgi:dephospho-CoA kinase|uniref:Dephospho-CoA kinase n=2 Tax=Heyndrickxia coagulans TaxID=1398 RepID=A0A150K6H2_HEYCO|nr:MULTISPECIES: dephospho-CoA kinase [Heyndrickxia]AEP01704.1 dephospho-CoA kinase [Heyndrickxia coagulans 36D1]APB36692.1 dephospho-CoA kinase [Heyndrickxia coagulans]AWP37568.1 dephospho-CoA kinase [Heyndrickxia coagulans]KWZ84688.1 dephospho-CoA kinase [Heyndrickxia coagulans]KYC64818.1 Dephospho-CoA kinase [Heyndrickxia coagulans]
MAKIIGLTGGIASGKSTVSNMLKTKGFTIVDADIAARKVVEPGELAYEQIIEAFGEGILLQDLTLDRKKLGALIFADEALRMKLNSIVHPAVRAWMTREKDRAIENGKKTVFLDIPLLFESRLTYMVERTILVYVDEETQLKRLMTRNGLSEKEAQMRIRAQMPLSEKKALADAVLDNNGSLEETKQQLEKIVSDWQLVP